MRRLIDFLDNLLNIFLVLFALLIIFISAYSLWDNYQIYRGARDSSLQAYKPKAENQTASSEVQNTATLTVQEKVTELPPLSEDYVFWLTLNGTLIDYPVMQGENNWEYLNKNAYGEFSLSGAIFLDSANDPALHDDFSIIYGHHMAYNAMFGSLDNYLYREYFDIYRRGTVITPAGTYDLNIFGVTYADGTDTKVYAPHTRTRSQILNYLRPKAQFWEEPHPDTRILGLSTCVSYENFKRLLVLAEILPEGYMDSKAADVNTDGKTAKPTAALVSAETAAASPTVTETLPPTKTASPTRTAAITPTPTVAETLPPIWTASPTRTAAITSTPTVTETLPPTRTVSPTRTAAITPTPAVTETLPPTRTASPTRTAAITPTPAVTETLPPTRTASPTRTADITSTAAAAVTIAVPTVDFVNDEMRSTEDAAPETEEVISSIILDGFTIRFESPDSIPDYFKDRY